MSHHKAGGRPTVGDFTWVTCGSVAAILKPLALYKIVIIEFVNFPRDLVTLIKHLVKGHFAVLCLLSSGEFQRATKI